MALKVLMLRKKLNDANKSLEALKAKDAELETREAELAQSIEEAATDEERTAVEEAITAYDADKAAHDEAKGNLERQIEELEKDLKTEEEKQNTDPAEPTAEPVREEGRAMATKYEVRDKIAALCEREDVKAMAAQVRTAIKEKRAITNAGLLIPRVLLGYLRENIMEYSKLYKHVFVRSVPGQGRMVIQGAIPEAVWTEMCATLNELDLTFSDIEVDGYKVGGYFRICNALLEDSDIDLVADLTQTLGQAIGLALDKAILYGTGTKMPTGIMTGIKAANIVSHAASVKDTDLFKALIGDSGLAKGKYSRGSKVWVMNETTYTTLIANSLAVDASGAIVAGVNGTMPVIGGVIEVLNFIPDNTIIGGYFDLYLLAERAGTSINTSEHAFWIEDQTGFKGTARYDGKVLVNDAFVAIGINGVTPSAAAVTFAADAANTPASNTNNNESGES